MKRATIRDLRYNFAKIEDLLASGEEVLITRRKHVIARILPAVQTERPPWPDFAGRLKRLSEGKKLKVSHAELLAQDRENRL